MGKALLIGIIIGLGVLVFLGWQSGWWKDLAERSSSGSLSFLSSPTPLPLLQYRIPELRNRLYPASSIIIEKKLADFPSYSSYLFSYQTLAKKMTGQLNVPKSETAMAFPVIVLIRGYVPLESYQTGAGTKGAAAVFAENGYVTLAPDFFGYGGSDPESSDTWEVRFQKPMSVVELFQSITMQPTLHLPKEIRAEAITVTLDSQKIGIWAHSNGGQIALTTLEILDRNIPTTLWAPVTAPFPYSILYFGDEEADEGKAARKMIELFEKEYEVTQFSLTHFLAYLHSPLQIQQGEKDEAIHFVWSEEFVTKLKAENRARQKILKEQQSLASESADASADASGAAQIDHPYLEPIPLTFYSYANTNHNMQPNWNIAIQRDLDFFAKYVR